jgi:hypothetical protein
VSAPPHPPPALEARIRAAIAAEPALAKTRLPVRRAIAALVVVLAAGTLALLRTRPDLGQIPYSTVLLSTLSLLTLAMVSVAVATTGGTRGLGAPVTVTTGVAIAAPIVYALVTATAPIHPADAVFVETGFCTRALPCGLGAIAVAAIGFVALLYALRGAVPVAPAARGAAIGAACGSWAGLAVHIHCAYFDRAHILFAHAFPVALFALLGWHLAPRFIKP